MYIHFCVQHLWLRAFMSGGCPHASSYLFAEGSLSGTVTDTNEQIRQDLLDIIRRVTTLAVRMVAYS